MGVLHVKDVVLEVLVEDAGLNFIAGLGGFELVFKPEERSCRTRREDERVEEAKQECAGGGDGADAHERHDAEAGGAHGGDFAVGREAAEAKEDADQDGHGNGEDERGGERVKDDAGDFRDGRGAADDELKDAAKVADEQDKGEDDAAQQAVGEDFAQDVAGKDAHEVSGAS